jgi:demethylmenaquinone methyltransferase/2-methoxy-6-polyprenyl-1,4-benzoquinol methylase
VVVTLPPPAEKRAFVSRMFDAIAPRYDAMNRVMTFGMDRGWRRATLASLAIRPGHVIVDLGCGTGDLSDGARAAGARAVGVDLSAGMLAQATRRGSAGTLVRADAGALPLADDSCDGAVSGFALRNFESIETVIRECARVVRGGGRVSLLEIDRPKAGPFASLFSFYFQRIVPFVGGVVSRGYAYRYLAGSTVYLPPWPELSAMLERAGFDGVHKRSMAGGTIQLVTAVRADSASRKHRGGSLIP